MVLEERTYTLKADYTPAMYFDLYQREALNLQVKILGRLIGYFHTEIGTLNSVVHIWGYDNLLEREQRRAKLAAEPAWQAYLKNVRPMLQNMENRILVPASFSPLK